ncbi:MAG: primosomal protein N' [Candidatus Magasanikbacteria bacterium]
MIAKVAPIRRMPKKISELDYLVPPQFHKSITVGQLVNIPFRNRLIYGMITEFKENETEEARGKLKSIENIVWENSALTLKQLSFVIEISEFYNTPLGFVLQSCLPPLKKTKIKKIQIQNADLMKPAVRKKPEIKLYCNKNGRNKLLEKLISSTGQTLILVPETSAISEILLPPETHPTIINAELSEKEIFDLWFKIRSEEIKIVIGTRRALFMPWSNLQTIIVDDEANPNHKSWDMAPRIQTREAAMMLAHAHGAQCFLTTHTPSVESWYFAQHNVYNNHEEVSALDPKVEIIDMQEERRGRNYGFLSLDLEDAIKQDGPGDIFLFLNRKGSSAYVGCRDCGYVAKCSQCSRGLVYHENTSTLDCHFCNLKIKMYLVCPKCHGANMIMYGVGTQSLEKELLKSNHLNKKIIRIDSDTVSIYDKSFSGDKIIIGTQIAWDKIDWSKIKMMSFIDADSSLFIPEYKMAENLWGQLRDAQYHLDPEARLLIQTGHADHHIFSSLMHPQSFYDKELQERKLFGYPPFSYLVRLYNGEKTLEQSKIAANNLFLHLQSLTKDRHDITISNPLPFSPSYTKGLHWHGIVVKISFEKYKQLTKFLAENIPENWKFDPNPNNLLSF